MTRIRPIVALVLAASARLIAQGSPTPQPAVAARITASAARLRTVTLHDSAYGRDRTIFVYTPEDYAQHPEARYPLLVAFDGEVYRDTMPLPFILDTLRSAKKAPAFVAVLIDDDGGPTRIADLGNAPRMVQFLSRQLLPWVRANYRVTTDPHRVIVTGSSAGGLASAYVAIERPDLFGNVLSQSCACWRGADGSNDAPYEWLTSRAAQLPARDVRFFLDVGALETRGALGGAAPSLRDANRHLRDVLLAKGAWVRYLEVPNGQHAPEWWAPRLPVGLVTLTADWR